MKLKIFTPGYCTLRIGDKLSLKQRKKDAKHLSVDISLEMHTKLKEKAASSQCSIKDLIILAINKILEKKQ